MTIQSMLPQLKEDGWNINSEYLENLQDKGLSYNAVVKLLMNADFKECGISALPNAQGKSSQIKTPIILQVTNVRNISAPKANEESTTAPRMLRVTLTDGINYMHGLEYSFIKSISLKTAPGTKLKLISKITSSGGYLLLNPSNTELVGGVVEELYQKWKLSESVSKYSRSTVASDGSGPPLWVPFGGKITVERENNFKALSDPASKKKENDDFEHQRQQVVSELAKEGNQKVFGGGKQMLDSNVQKIINSGGFTVEEAEWALKRNKNDVHRSIQELRRVQCGGNDIMDVGKTYFPPPEDRGRGRGGKRGRGRGGKGKDDKGPDGSDDEVPHSAVSRPSGPASLLDYLESRILDKSDSEPPVREEERQDFRHARGRRGRGNYNGRGRGDFKQKANPFKSEPSLSSENWPSLGQETNNAAQVTKNQVSNNAQRDMSSAYYLQQEAPSHDANSHSPYSNYEPQSNKYNQAPPQRDSNQGYRYNESSYRNNPPSKPPANYREPMSNQQNYNRNYQQPYQQQHNAYRPEPIPPPPPQKYNNDFDPGESTHRRKAEQPYYRRGMGRSSTSHQGHPARFQGYSQKQGTYPQHYNQHEEYYHHAEGGNSSYNGSQSRVHTAKEKELIAQFEKSMVMAGCYEASSYNNPQNSNNYSQAFNQDPHSSYNSQGYSGTYEYHRGGDGYPKRSRGGRRGRY